MNNTGKFFALSCLAYSLSACTSVQAERNYTAVSSTPIVSTNSVSKKFACYKDKLKEQYLYPENKEFTIGLYVKGITDGTVPEGGDSPLADSGRLQMLGSLGKLFQFHPQVLVNYHFPRNLANPTPTTEISEHDGVNGQGFLSQEAFNNIALAQINTINNRRGVLPSFSNQIAKQGELYIIDGAFSRNDSDDGSFSRGWGTSGEYEKKNKIAEIEWGKTQGKKYLSLTILIIHPLSNSIDSAETFELLVNKNKNTAELTVGRSGVKAGIAIEKEEVESLHDAQQVLIDYASLWITDQLLSEAADFEKLPLELKKC